MKKKSHINVTKVSGTRQKSRGAREDSTCAKAPKVTRNSSTGRVMIQDRVGSAVKGAKSRYGETLRRLK